MMTSRPITSQASNERDLISPALFHVSMIIEGVKLERPVIDRITFIESDISVVGSSYLYTHNGRESMQIQRPPW